MPPVEIQYGGTYNNDPNVKGITFTSNNGERRITVYDSGNSLTEVHEIGHCIDGYFNISRSEIGDDIFDAMDSVDKVSNLISQTKGLSPKTVDYILSPDECFARAYSQYIATKSGNKMLLDNLKSVYNSGKLHGGLWSDEDFKPIFAAFEKTFKKIGLEK